jgi:hypothetical protein
MGFLDDAFGGLPDWAAPALAFGLAPFTGGASALAYAGMQAADKVGLLNALPGWMQSALPYGMMAVAPGGSLAGAASAGLSAYNALNSPGVAPTAAHKPAPQPGGLSPAEQQALDFLRRRDERAAGEREQIEGFYSDPERQREINLQVDPALERAMLGLQETLRERGRQEAFARARTGNLGGSVQAGQQAGLEADAQQAGAQLAAQAQAQRDALTQALDQARIRELLGTYQHDPYTNQAIEARLRGMGLLDDQNAALAQLAQEQRELDRAASTQFSQDLGGIVDALGNAFTQHYRQQSMGKPGFLPFDTYSWGR